MNAALPRPWLMLAMGLLCCCTAQARPVGRTAEAARQPAPTRPLGAQRGKASVYSRKLAHHAMADGTPLELESDSAASLHLPLGSRARVTNLHNGRSAEVVIRDRGPFVKGRIIDLTPKTARLLGFRTGVRRVEVTPLPLHPAAPVAVASVVEAYRPPRRCRVFGMDGYLLGR